MPELRYPWHQMAAEHVLDTLQNSPQGLSAAEAQRRLAEYGPNILREGKRRGPVGMLLAQFTDFMILILLAAALISGLIGEAHDAIAIIAIVVMNAVIGFIQEYRAERAMEALKAMRHRMPRCCGSRRLPACRPPKSCQVMWYSWRLAALSLRISVS